MNCAAAGICRRVMSDVGNFFLGLRLNHVVEKRIGEFLVRTGLGDHQVIDPAGGIFAGNNFGDGEIGLAELIGHERPAHRRDDFVIFEKVGQFAAGGPDFANIGLEGDEFLFYGGKLVVSEIVELRGIGLVVAEKLRSHVYSREVIPDGNLSFVFGIPENGPGIGGLREGRGVVEQRIGAPHKRHTKVCPPALTRGSSRSLGES